MAEIGNLYDIYLVGEEVLEKDMKYGGRIDRMHEFTKSIKKENFRVIRAGELDERGDKIILNGNYGIFTRKGEAQ